MHIQKRHPGIGAKDTWDSRKYDDGIVDDFVVKLEHVQPFEMATRRLDGSQIRTVRCSTRCLLHHLQGLGRTAPCNRHATADPHPSGWCATTGAKCTLHLWRRRANVLGMARRVSCPIVCLLTSVCSAHSLIQRKPSSNNRVLHLDLGVQ
jgi:hypothetical protein